MENRQKALALVRALSDAQVESLLTFLESLNAQATASGPTEAERAAAREHLRRIATREDDRYDFSISEHLHASR
jgi:ribosomal protein L12E/L44/L45/RPP1/RPP2